MSYLLATCDANRLALPDQSVDLVIGSPPYMDARTYGIGAQRGCVEWVEWMLGVTTEALRVSRGAVVWVMAGVTRDRNYWPGCEGLAYEWFRRGGHAYRPCYWHRVGVPGSGGDQWFRADVEYAMAFKRPGKLPWTDNTALADPPKCAPGGAMANRLGDGRRVNKLDRPPDKARRKRQADGSREDQGYYAPVLANPGNLLSRKTGGGCLGHELAHINEAPYPEGVPEFFVKSLCPPAGLVLDPFGGSGTTASVAARSGRVGLSFDLRPGQADLARRRIEDQLQAAARPHAPRPGKPKVARPVGQASFLDRVPGEAEAR